MHKMCSQGRVPKLWQDRSLVAEACIWTACGEFFGGFCLVGLVCCLFVGVLFGVLFAFLFAWFFNTRIKLLKIEPQ